MLPMVPLSTSSSSSVVLSLPSTFSLQCNKGHGDDKSIGTWTTKPCTTDYTESSENSGSGRDRVHRNTSCSGGDRIHDVVGVSCKGKLFRDEDSQTAPNSDESLLFEGGTDETPQKETPQKDRATIPQQQAKCTVEEAGTQIECNDSTVLPSKGDDPILTVPASIQAGMMMEKQCEISETFAQMVMGVCMILDQKEKQEARRRSSPQNSDEEIGGTKRKQLRTCARAVTSLIVKQAEIADNIHAMVTTLDEQRHEAELEKEMLQQRIKSLEDQLKHGPYDDKRPGSQIEHEDGKQPTYPKHQDQRQSAFGNDSDDTTSIAVEGQHEEPPIKEIIFHNTMIDVTKMSLSSNELKLPNDTNVQLLI